MTFLCDQSPEHILRARRTCRLEFDDFGAEHELFAEIFGATERIDTASLAADDAALRLRYPGFFTEYPYRWSCDRRAYDLASESTSQHNLLTVMCVAAPRIDPARRRECLGNTMVVETVAPCAVSTAPVATAADGHNFILLPMGWREGVLRYLSVLAATGRAASDDVVSAALMGVVEVGSHLVFEGWRDERGTVLHPTIVAALRILARRALGEYCRDQLRVREDDLSALVDEPWKSVNTATIAFAMAHELAHIVFDEHRGATGSYDEVRADQHAVDFIGSSEFCRPNFGHLPESWLDVIVPMGMACFVAANEIWRVTVAKTLEACAPRAEEPRGPLLITKAVGRVGSSYRGAIDGFIEHMRSAELACIETATWLRSHLNAASRAVEAALDDALAEQLPHGGVLA